MCADAGAIEHVAKRRMRRLAVVALQVVVDQSLPVAGDRIVKQPPVAVRHKVPDSRDRRFDLVGQTRCIGRQRFGLRVEIDEDKVEKPIDADLREADLGPVDWRRAGSAANADQLPVQLIGPGVIRADETSGGAGTLDQLMPAMGAYVIECPDLVVLASDHDDVLIEDRQGHEVARAAQRRGVAGVLPGSEKQRVAFDRQYRRVGVVIGWQRSGRPDVAYGRHRRNAARVRVQSHGVLPPVASVRSSLRARTQHVCQSRDEIRRTPTLRRFAC